MKFYLVQFLHEQCLTKEKWRAALGKSNIVDQWDPDHEPFTNKKFHRRAIQLGIRPDLLKCFGRENGQGKERAASSLLSSSLQARSDNSCGIIAIEDITKFFKATREHAMQQEDPLIDLRTPLGTI